MTSLSIKPISECMYDCISFGEVMLKLDPGEGRIRTVKMPGILPPVIWMILW
jgi:2-dehydro-3-deoxygluconokinase